MFNELCARRGSHAFASSSKRVVASPNALRSQKRMAAASHARPDVHCDLILSSGFLAFANHSGFLKAVEKAGIKPSGIMGTSAGALTGSLYAAGYTPAQVAKELSRVPPIQLLSAASEPWRAGGVLSLDPVIERLRELLPARFEDLEHDFAVGVVSREGRHLLIDHGPLPEAVAASAAIPYVFAAVDVPGKHDGPFIDGGVVDRIALKAWRARRRAQLSAAAGAVPGSANGAPPPCLVHVIHRSTPFSGDDDALGTGEPAITLVRSPKAGVSFFDLGDFHSQMDAAFERALPTLQQVRAAAVNSGAGAGGEAAAAVAALPRNSAQQFAV